MNTSKIDNDILINTFSNLDKESHNILFSTDINFIQFHFCLEGKMTFSFNNGSYKFDLNENNSIILFNPSTNLPIDAVLEKNTKYLSLLITIKKFHGLFSELTDNISFLSQENSGKKYYKENVITPQISTVLNQIMNEKLSENVKNLYLKGKIFELLGMYFNESNDSASIDTEFIELIYTSIGEQKIVLDNIKVLLSIYKNDEQFKKCTDAAKRSFPYDVRHEYFNALQVKFAYAVTCHKAQGGQWKSIFIDQGYLPEDTIDIEYLRWLHTAFTRATERVSPVNFKCEFYDEDDYEQIE